MFMFCFCQLTLPMTCLLVYVLERSLNYIAYFGSPSLVQFVDFFFEFSAGVTFDVMSKAQGGVDHGYARVRFSRWRCLSCPMW